MTLEIIASDLLADFKHGFFTRKGGASSGIYKGLNCGPASHDQSDAVRINRERVAESLGSTYANLAGCDQVHSADVVTVTGPLTSIPKADALVTNTAGVALSILTADCQPILFADPNAKVIGAAHAGWKGALGGIIGNTIDAMVNLGASRTSIHAVIGPCISQDAYEVGPEFLETFAKEDADAHRFFKQGGGDRFHFDLAGYGLRQIEKENIASAHWTGDCTYSDPDRFYSYRRSVHKSENDYGRLLSGIAL